MTSGQSMFGFFGRVAGTTLAMVFSILIWYVALILFRHQVGFNGANLAFGIDYCSHFPLGISSIRRYQGSSSCFGFQYFLRCTSS